MILLFQTNINLSWKSFFIFWPVFEKHRDSMTITKIIQFTNLKRISKERTQHQKWFKKTREKPWRREPEQRPQGLRKPEKKQKQQNSCKIKQIRRVRIVEPGGRRIGT